MHTLYVLAALLSPAPDGLAPGWYGLDTLTADDCAAAMVAHDVPDVPAAIRSAMANLPLACLPESDPSPDVSPAR